MAEIPITDARRFTPLNSVLFASVIIFFFSLIIIPLRFLLVPSLVIILIYAVIIFMKIWALR